MTENQAQHFIHAWLPARRKRRAQRSLNAVYRPTRGHERGLAGPNHGRKQVLAVGAPFRVALPTIVYFGLAQRSGCACIEAAKWTDLTVGHGLHDWGCTWARSRSELRGAPHEGLPFRWCATRSCARRRGSHSRALGKRHLDQPRVSLSASVFAPVVRRGRVPARELFYASNRRMARVAAAAAVLRSRGRNELFVKR